MQLREAQKKHLRGLGHALKPVILVGDAGLSDSLLKETESAIEHHELIKVRIRAADRTGRDQMIEQLITTTGATLINRIGNVALIYRHNPDKKAGIALPRAKK